MASDSSSASGPSRISSRRRRIVMQAGSELCGGRSRRRFVEPVSESAHGADGDFVAELAAQPGNVYFDRVRGDAVLPARDRLLQAVLGDDLAGVQRQALEDRPLAPRQ